MSIDFVDQYVHKLQVNREFIECFAKRSIDGKSREIVSDVYGCGIISGVMGGFLAAL